MVSLYESATLIDPVIPRTSLVLLSRKLCSCVSHRCIGVKARWLRRDRGKHLHLSALWHKLQVDVVANREIECVALLGTRRWLRMSKSCCVRRDGSSRRFVGCSKKVLIKRRLTVSQCTNFVGLGEAIADNASGFGTWEFASVRTRMKLMVPTKQSRTSMQCVLFYAP